MNECILFKIAEITTCYKLISIYYKLHCELRYFVQCHVILGARRKQMDIGGAGNSRNLGGIHPQIILKSRTAEIRFPAFWEVISYRKAHYKIRSLGTSRSGFN